MTTTEQRLYIMDNLQFVEDERISELAKIMFQTEVGPTIYDTLSNEEKAELQTALDSINQGHGIPAELVFAKTDAMLKAAARLPNQAKLCPSSP